MTHNQALRQLDQLLHLCVPSRSVPDAPPPLPPAGTRVLVPQGGTGAWGGKGGMLAAFVDGAWSFIQPRLGWTLFVEDEERLLVHDGEAFRPVQAALPASVEQWGINAMPDATNRLAVSSPATLLNHAGADHRLVINKAAAADTSSLVFQTGFSGRAEMGLGGDDAFRIKVSAAGSTWKEALRADPASGLLAATNGLTLGTSTTALRHYQEGSWTPQLRGAAAVGTPSYGQAEGAFLRIGNLVMVNARLTWTAPGGLSGAASIANLPYPVRAGLANRSPLIASWYNGLAMGASVTLLGGFTEPGTSEIRLWGASDPGEGINKLLVHTDLSEDGEIAFTCLYLV